MIYDITYIKKTINEEFFRLPTPPRRSQTWTILPEVYFDSKFRLVKIFLKIFETLVGLGISLFDPDLEH